MVKEVEKAISHEGICSKKEDPEVDYRYQIIKYGDKIWVRLYTDSDNPDNFYRISSKAMNDMCIIKS